MNTVAELKQILSRLETLTGATQGGAGSSGGPQAPAFTEFDAAVQELKDAAAAVKEQALKDMTDIVLKAFEHMKAVTNASLSIKKPNMDQIKVVQKAMIDNINKIAKFGSNQAVQPHSKVLLEGLNCCFWVLSDQPKFVFDGAIEPAEFVGLKVQHQKIQENSQWYYKFIHALKTLAQYQQENFKMGLNWNPQGTRTIESLVAELKGEKATAAPSGGAPPPPAMAPPPPQFTLAPATDADAGLDRGALFAQINVGEDITKMLKKVDKNAPKKDPVSQAQKQQKAQTQQKQQVVKKPPRKYLRENWFVENFENERLIEFKEDEIDMKQSLFLDNCVNCGVIVKHKIKAIFLNNCKKIQLVFGQTVTGLEIVKTKRVEVTILNSCPSMTIDGCEQVHVTFNQSKQCDIVSSKTMDLNITYLQADGELAKDNTVPEQFVTVFDNDANKWVTKPLDIFL